MLNPSYNEIGDRLAFEKKMTENNGFSSIHKIEKKTQKVSCCLFVWFTWEVFTDERVITFFIILRFSLYV